MMIVNVSAYRFQTVPREDLARLKADLQARAVTLALKGTILLAEEGINLYVAGESSAIQAYQAFLADETPFGGLFYKESQSETAPFRHMRVKIRRELIRMNVDFIQPERGTAPHVLPAELKRWYEEGKEMIVLDTRNDYEVALGTFQDAISLHIEKFTEFPEALKQLPESAKQKPIVTFCTGGIRCEKAAAYMLHAGFTEVYQLSGGILNYFTETDGAYYNGECFVFDHRLTIDTTQTETQTEACLAARVNGAVHTDACPYCAHLRESRRGVTA
ncbi:MAG: hypothetical protein A3J38_01145 [Gammaproteobacteria bacterium RIFCSPHIGHO2_12_FULL_45_9]|nr:MAG: hypothetical protein A3J38_01145 [Gammaproteobacteria bacterium RIFCSPHIGHO2_12_FULL_45_9]